MKKIRNLGCEHIGKKPLYCSLRSQKVLSGLFYDPYVTII